MADDDPEVTGQPAVFEGEERKFDQPRDRRTEFFRLLNTTPQVFRAAVEQAIAFTKLAPQDGLAERWTPLGPRNVGGSMRAIVQDPRKPTTLYAGSGFGGLWKTEDDGYTWRQLGGADLLLPIGALAMAPSDSKVLYVGTGETAFNTIQGRGLWRTRNAGDSFDRVIDATSGANGSAAHYTRIQVDPNDAGRFWAASDTGLWRFEPNGSVVNEPIPLGNGINDVVLAPDPANANQYVLLAGIDGTGIQRGVFNRTTNTTAWAAVAGNGLPAAGTIARVRLAFARATPGVAGGNPIGYAVFEDAGFMPGAAAQGFPTVVLQSTDFGQTWPRRNTARSPEPSQPGDTQGQAFYSLVIEVDPSTPTRVIVGYVDLHVSTDAGLHWSTLLDWRLYDNGDRAQHADFHAILFDARNARALWVCNDGGISYSPDIRTLAPNPFAKGIVPAPTPKPVWRKKSYGITCAQFVDITTHPTYPFIVGGGMQDNGTFVSYGGQTWYRLMGADGGALGMDPNDPRRFWPTWQSANEFVRIGPPPAPPTVPQNTARLPEVSPPNNVMVPLDTGIRFPTNAAGNDRDPQTFIGVLENDPQTSNFLLLGRSNTCYYTTDGNHVAKLRLPGFAGSTSALAFASGAAPRQKWIGTTSGQVFTLAAALPNVNSTVAPGVNPPQTGPAWTNVSAAGMAGNPISSIAVHPLNSNVVAVASWAGGIFLSQDATAAAPNWTAINGAALALPPGATAAVAWDPADTGVLFAGTVAGVYVCRNIPANPAGTQAVPAFTPEWRSYSLGLPFILVNDLAVAPVTNTLRCGTFGRGVFEANIRGATPAAFAIPDVLLSIREHATDDARTYVAPNVFFSDPRLPQPPNPQPGDYDHTHAIDIRIDAPSFVRSEAFTFGETIDGSEFDETLTCDRPLVGDTNFVYVQVQNRGSQPATNVRVFLWYADAGNAAPPVAPAITGDLNYPNTPADASPWKLASIPQEVGVVQPGQPVVVQFDWNPPVEILNNVALLAVCSNDQDSLAAIPAGAAVAFVTGERRAALRIIAVDRDMVFIRDGVDDDGTRGGVSWGGRSPDIIVRQGAAVANPNDPNGTFKDLGDSRLGDRARPGANLVYVRVSNRTRSVVNARVRLFQLQPANAAAPATWVAVGGTVNVANIPAKGWRMAGPINWPVPADPDPGTPADQKAVALLAMTDTLAVGGAELDPFPDPSGITDIGSFWRFFLTAPLANNVAMRALRFTTAPPGP